MTVGAFSKRGKTVNTKWDRVAVKAAAYITDNLFEAHRGAIHWAPGVVAIFGNDDYAHDKRTVAEVEAVRAALPSASCEELGFGLAPDDQYTWVMLVKSAPADNQTAVGKRFKTELLKGICADMVWNAWRSTRNNPDPSVSGFEAWQRGIADAATEQE
jgi:hypothetical protein